MRIHTETLAAARTNDLRHLTDRELDSAAGGITVLKLHDVATAKQNTDGSIQPKAGAMGA
jgi:hypothetical protein